MKKINLLLLFIMAGKLLFAQYVYFDDPNALRING